MDRQQPPDHQHDALAAMGISAEHVYTDRVTDETDPGLWAALARLLEDVTSGDAVVVVSLDRLGRDAIEVAETIRELGDRGVTVRPLGELPDSSTATGLIHAGVVTGRSRSQTHHDSAGDARFVHKRPVGRPRALDAEKVALVNWLFALGVSKTAIARTLGVSRPTIYRALADA